jgi:Uma2 family endonuclease
MSDAALNENYCVNRRWTYADYKDWELTPGERYEIIDGETYAMAAPTTRHQAMLIEMATQIHTYLRGKPCKVYPAPFDVRLFYEEDESDDTVVQPDIAVICDEKKRGKEGCRGAPDFVAEILSPSNTASVLPQTDCEIIATDLGCDLKPKNAAILGVWRGFWAKKRAQRRGKDAARCLRQDTSEMQTKFDLYRQAGVREYWVLDGDKNRLHAYRFEAGKIASFASYGAAEKPSVGIFSDLTIDLEPVFAE